MYDNINTEFRKKVLLTTVAFCILLPLLNCYGLQLFYAYQVEGNVEYKNVSALINNLINFLNNIATYAGYGILIYMIFLYRIKGSTAWIKINAVSILLSCGAGIVIKAVITSNILSNIKYDLTYLAMQLAIEAALLYVICLTAAKIRKNALSENRNLDIALNGEFLPKKSNPLLRSFMWAVIIYTAEGLAMTAIETSYLLINTGMPVNRSETWTLISPYVKLAVYLLVGYCVMIGIANLLESLWYRSADSGNNEENAQGEK